ncbi:MAG: hypothetical protein JZU47_18230 [Prolixibacteraceae bacterium]|nr:hypothetical protein [Prolixibacteraceae bacterium]
MVSSLVIWIINISIWLLEWSIIVKYNTFRYEPIFYISFLGFLLISTFQFINEWVEEEKINGKSEKIVSELNGKDHVKTMITIGSSVLLSLSILASLPILKDSYSPFLTFRFHLAALMSFLWIVFGVFWTLSSESQFQLLSIKLIRKLKSASLLHALGWAGTAAIMLINSLKLLNGTP